MNKKKQILLAVTGGTPAVITETLYGLHLQNEENKNNPNFTPFWPEEIHILTTQFGKKQAILRLLNLVTDPHSKKEYSGQLARFCDIYQLPIPNLTGQTIHVIPDANGNDVDDARTAADQDALADFIMKAVAELTADDNIQIHASIAGGRKTMGYYLGSAMGMFGRIGDTLSHVLIDADFENIPSFYFPTKVDEVGENTYLKKAVNFKDAKVSLANIAFIRHRQMLDKQAIADFAKANVLKRKEVNNKGAAYPLSYLDLVCFQNAADLVRFSQDKQQELQKFKLDFDLPNKKLNLFHPELPVREIDFSQNTLLFAYYAMIGRYNQPGTVAMHTLADFDTKAQFGMLLVLELLRISGVKEHELNQLKNLAENDNFYDFHQLVKASGFADLLKAYSSTTMKKIAALGTDDKQTPSAKMVGLDKQFMVDRNKDLSKLLLMYYPKELVKLIKPSGVWQFDKSQSRNTERLAFYEGNNKPHTSYGLWVKSNLAG